LPPLPPWRRQCRTGSSGKGIPVLDCCDIALRQRDAAKNRQQDLDPLLRP
jgi:hypothetical protein